MTRISIKPEHLWYQCTENFMDEDDHEGRFEFIQGSTNKRSWTNKKATLYWCETYLEAFTLFRHVDGVAIFWDGATRLSESDGWVVLGKKGYES